MIEIYLFLISLFFLIYYQCIISKKLNSPFFIYSFFLFVYIFFPAIYVNYNFSVVNIEMKYLTKDFVASMTNFATATNLCILFSFKFAFKNLIISLDYSNQEKIEKGFVRFLSHLFFLFYPICLLLVYLFPWPKFGEEVGVFHSVATFSKILLLLFFASICYRLKFEDYKKNVAIFAFFIFCALSFIDSARTHMFVAFFLMSYGLNIKIFHVIKYFFIFFIFFIFFVYMTLSRTGMDFSFEYLFWPFFAEGIFGSYGTLNNIAIMENIGWDYSRFFYFFGDIFFGFFGFLNDFFGYTNNLEKISEEAERLGVLEGKINPLGGHFFLTEMIFYYGYLAPFAFCLLFFVWIYFLNKINGVLRVLIYSTSFFLVKVPVLVILKNYIAIFIFYFAIKLFYNLLPKK